MNNNDDYIEAEEESGECGFILIALALMLLFLVLVGAGWAMH